MKSVCLTTWSFVLYDTSTANPIRADTFECCFKAQSSNVSFHRNVAKETFELWALSFRKWHPKWNWLYHTTSSFVCGYEFVTHIWNPYAYRLGASYCMICVQFCDALHVCIHSYAAIHVNSSDAIHTCAFQWYVYRMLHVQSYDAFLICIHSYYAIHVCIP